MQTEQQPKIAPRFPPDGVGRGCAAEAKATTRLRTGLSRPGRNHSSHPRRRRSKGVGVIVVPASVSSRPGRGTCRQARSRTRGGKTGRGPGAASFLRYAKLPTSSRLCGLLSQRGRPCSGLQKPNNERNDDETRKKSLGGARRVEGNLGGHR